MERRIGILTLSLILVFYLGVVNLSFSDDAIGLESWRERAHEGNFAQGIAGVYLIRHHTDEGTPGAFRLISLTAGGTWASTHSDQHAIVNFPGVPFLSEDSGNDLLSEGGLFLPEDFFDLSTLFNPSRFSDQHGVWVRSGWRELTAEVVDFNLDALTGAHTDIVRVRYVVQFSKDLQSVTGMQRGRVFPLDQDPLDPEAVPAMEFDSLFTGRRVTVEAE